MRHIRQRITGTLLCLFGAALAHAQQAQPTAAAPRLIRFGGSFHPANGMPAQTTDSMTRSVYRDQTGGDALWHEIQNAAVDADGHYSIVMGATQSDGMPGDLFVSGEPRWLGVQFNRPGEAEQPRVLLVSVPYALKAADAETLGGKPTSAYMLTPSAAGAAAPVRESAAATVKPKTVVPGNSGAPNYIGKFTNTTDLVSSSMYEVNGNVGIFTTTPAISLDVRTGSLPQMGIAGKTDYLTFFASDQYGPAIYWDPAKDMRFGKGGSGLYNPFGFVEQMRIQSSTGNVGIGTIGPASKLDVAGDINLTGNLKSGGDVLLRLNQLGADNIGLGRAALALNTSGTFNTALGMNALQSNTTGSQGTATGFLSLGSNTTGVANTGDGNGTLSANTTGSFNTATGDHALYSNTGGSDNTAQGQGALFLNRSGTDNTASGYLALYSNLSDQNTATGAYAMYSMVGGIGNTAIGLNALYGNSEGTGNTAIGSYALSQSTGGYNIALGNVAGYNITGGGYNIEIGTTGDAADSSTIRIGALGFQNRFFAAGVYGTTTGSNDGVPVVVDSKGQLGTASSSRRFKEDIEDMGDASRDLMRLRPVTFRYKQPYTDGSKPIQYGLIAEEVAEVYPELVAHSADGQIETVKYQVLDSMLLNEAQRQRAEIHAQKDQIQRLEQRNQSLEERLARLESALASTFAVARASASQ